MKRACVKRPTGAASATADQSARLTSGIVVVSIQTSISARYATASAKPTRRSVG